MLALPHSYQGLVARTYTLHLDTYSISAGKVLWNFTGERRGRGGETEAIRRVRAAIYESPRETLANIGPVTR